MKNNKNSKMSVEELIREGYIKTNSNQNTASTVFPIDENERFQHIDIDMENKDENDNINSNKSSHYKNIETVTIADYKISDEPSIDPSTLSNADINTSSDNNSSANSDSINTNNNDDASTVTSDSNVIDNQNDTLDNNNSNVSNIDDDIKPNKSKKKLIRNSIIGVALFGVLVTGIKACTNSSNNNDNDLENLETISTDDELVENTTIKVTTTTVTLEPQETKKEENELEKYATIKYINKKEFTELLKLAEKEFEGTEVTVEELCSFVYTINKTVINSELKEILIEAGVISEDEELVRKNYLNTIDKTRDAMFFEKAYETVIEIDKEIAEEYKEHGKAIHVSNMVSKNSSEYETYKVLDKAYEEIGNAKTKEEAHEAYLPVWGYVNSIYGENMPNNVEEEIFNDLYIITYNEITSFNLNASIDDITGYKIGEVDSCEKVYSLS